MSPCTRPPIPDAGFSIAPDDGQSKEVVQAPAVAAYFDHFGFLKYQVQGHRSAGCFPEVGACPALRLERKAHFDVQVFRKEPLHGFGSHLLRFFELPDDELLIDARAKVGIRHIEEFRVQVLFLFQD